MIKSWKIMHRKKDKVVTDTFKFLNKTDSNALIISQEYTVCFQISGEAKTKYNKY